MNRQFCSFFQISFFLLSSDFCMSILGGAVVFHCRVFRKVRCIYVKPWLGVPSHSLPLGSMYCHEKWLCRIPQLSLNWAMTWMSPWMIWTPSFGHWTIFFQEQFRALWRVLYLLPSDQEMPYRCLLLKSTKIWLYLPLWSSVLYNIWKICNLSEV